MAQEPAGESDKVVPEQKNNMSEDEFPNTARIELAPRAGIMTSTSKAAPKPPAKTPAPKPRSALPSGPPLELRDTASPAPDIPPLPVPPVPTPAAALPSTPPSPPEPAPAAAPASAAPAAAAVPAVAPAAAPAVKPEVRRMAFLYSAQSEPEMRRFMTFLDEVSGKVSRKPLAIERALVRAVQGVEAPGALLAEIRAAQAAGTVAMLAPLAEAWSGTVEQAFEKEGAFLRVVAPEDTEKRSAAVDILVELMLLPGKS